MKFQGKRFRLALLATLFGFSHFCFGYIQIITIYPQPQPEPPIVVLSIPASLSFPGYTNPVVIGAACDQPAEFVLDGSASYDRGGYYLTYAWTEGTNVLGSFPSGTVSGDFGEHTVTLRVGNSSYSVAVTNTFEVIAPCTALTTLESAFDEKSFPKRIQRNRRMLEKALLELGKGQLRKANNELKDFKRKAGSQIKRVDPSFASTLQNSAQGILDALGVQKKRSSK